ncbi:LytR/AlgR family response regulator transcription factor [Algoriphagus namhaensis]
MNILIIEDENPAAQRLKRLIAPHFPEAILHGNLDSVKSALHWLKSHPIPDLIFCDIQLADGLSFEIFKEIKVTSPVIFTTAFDQYAIKAFEVNAVDYLLKPLDPEALNRSVEKFKANQHPSPIDYSKLQALLQAPVRSFKSRFLVKFGEKIQSIPVSEVSYFFSESKVTYLQSLSGKRYILDSTLEQTEEMLDPERFFRINRKYLITLESIEAIYAHSNSRLKLRLKFTEDPDIIVSRDRTGEFKLWLDR